MDRFQILLYDLGQILELPLYAENNKCRLLINELLDIQMEYDSAKERVLIICFCCDIPPGKFRENTLKEALKANAIYPRLGTYGFSEQKNKLAIFDYISLENLSSDKFADILAQFIERAEKSKKAVDAGSPMQLSDVSLRYDKSAFEI